MTKKAEATTILNYLNSQNRPYNSTDIFNNLRGEISKTNVQKYLTELAQDGLITSKTFGKQTVYVAKQDDLPTLTNEELGQYDAKIEMTKETVSETKDTIRLLQNSKFQLTKELNSLSNSLTDEQLQVEITSLGQQIKDLTERLETLKNGGQQMSAQDKDRIEKKLLNGRKMWAARKKLFKEIWGAFTENLPKKPKEYMDEIGIETDEMVGADINK